MANGNYGGIINNFMDELSQPPGNTVYDRFGNRILVTHLPCCSHLAHLLTLTFRMFNWIHYKELSGAENRFVNSFVWGLQQHTSKTACSWNQSDTVGVSVSNVFEFFFLRLFHTRSINMTKPKKQLKRGFFRLSFVCISKCLNMFYQVLPALSSLYYFSYFFLVLTLWILLCNEFYIKKNYLLTKKNDLKTSHWKRLRTTNRNENSCGWLQEPGRLTDRIWPTEKLN